MKDYKYAIPTEDIYVMPENRIVLHKDQIYEIDKINDYSEYSVNVKIKNPVMWKLSYNLKLLTESDIRRLKINLIQNKL